MSAPSARARAKSPAAVAGVPELIHHEVNGLLVPPEDPAALAAAIERALRTPELRRRLGGAAEQRVRTSFDHRAGIRRLTDLFDHAWDAA